MLEHRRVDAALLARRHGATSGEKVHDRELGTGRAGDPLIRVQPRERAARTDVHEAWRVLELGAGVGKVELLRHRRAPALEKIGADRNNELRVGEAHSRPRDAVGATIGLDRGMIGLEIDAEVRPHAEGGQPLIEKRGKAPRFVLIEKDRVGRGRASTR